MAEGTGESAAVRAGDAARPSMSMIDAEAWYRDTKERTGEVGIYCALSISVMVVLSQVGHWRNFALVLGLQISMVPLNIVFDRFIAPRAGQRSEVYRAIGNNLVCFPVFHAVGWPLPVWFWLPFTAIALDTPTIRHGLTTMLSICALQIVGALALGVEWRIPVAFSCLAMACWAVTATRTRVIREMVRNAQLQRAELEAVHEGLKAEIAARERAEVELRQAQKLEAIGRLAAGVAHEINTPMQFVSDSLEFVTDGANELIALARRCASADQAEKSDLAYLTDNMPTALAHAHDGVKRVASIIRSMKEFAHPGGAENEPVDLNVAIQNTLTISTYEYKLVADVVTELDDLPTVRANAGELNQVLLNLIVNAAHAIADHAQPGERGRILIKSRREMNAVVITISDTGGGIPDAIRSKVFDPFFTTKEVGRGTGQGLAIARAVVERHGGTLTFETRVGLGTTFRLRLPVAMQSQMIPTAA